MRLISVPPVPEDYVDAQIKRDSPVILSSGFENFEDEERLEPAPVSPVTSATPEDWQSLVDNVQDTTDVLDAATASVMKSLERTVRPSVAISRPGGVDGSSWIDTACLVQPEASDIIPEAPEGSPSPMDILSVSTGASVPTFPGERRIEVGAPPSISPTITSFLSRLNDLDEIDVHQQSVIDQGSYLQYMMRKSMRLLAEFAGVDVGDDHLGCQCPGKR